MGLEKNLNKYTCSDIPQLREEITEKYSDLLGPLPLKLPPFHEVSHEIPLIDESKQLKHRLPKCPEAFCSGLTQNIERYTRVLGTSSHKTSDTNAGYTKEKQYIKNRVQSATAEQEYVERCNTFPRSRCNMS